MLREERQAQLVRYVNSRKKATVQELSDVLNVSKVTVRRDLDELNDAALLIKTFGGALSKDNMLTAEIPSSKKTNLCVEEKRRIGTVCAEMVEDGDVVILDSGTTTLEIARRITEKHITVITSDLNIAMLLAPHTAVTVFLAGGIVDPNVYVTIGNEAERLFSQLYANKTFLGADALSLEHGITDRAYAQLPIKRAMLSAGQRKILAADHTKFEKEVFAQVCQLSTIDTLVTDRIDPTYQEALQAAGVEVMLG